VAEGAFQVRASLGKSGAMTLQIGDAEPVTAKAANVLPKQPAEDFNLGFDAKRPVDDYDGKPVFKGSISKLVIR